MRGLIYAVSTCALTLMFNPGHAIAECSPPDFKNVNFSNLHDLTKYAFLSSIKDQNDQKLAQSFNSGMTIPYIDVPATGDFAQTKEQMRQVERLTQVHLEQDHTETLLNIAWDELGLSAYKECLNAQKGEAVIVEPLQGTAPFGSQLALSITWQRRTKPDTAKQVRDVICLGCTASNLKKGDPIEVGVAQVVVLSRKPGENLSLIVNVDGLIGQFHLPRSPRSITKSFNHDSVTVSATNRQGNNLRPLNDVICWPNEKVKLKIGEEFLIGTANGNRVGQGGPCGSANEPVVTVKNANQVCWKFDVMSCDVNNGYSGTYNLTAESAFPAD
jgi:hypothetical protein